MKKNQLTIIVAALLTLCSCSNKLGEMSPNYFAVTPQVTTSGNSGNSHRLRNPVITAARTNQAQTDSMALMALLTASGRETTFPAGDRLRFDPPGQKAPTRSAVSI